ncbi:helix-turn-helix domain-containing protein [Paenibacillus sp. IITD108]|uniref:helix-turn-helix domain-containing protein n=1 Tax=Paenibacillus sp. IITD108 TaxID=3116649 RepID=UPI002F41EAF0
MRWIALNNRLRLKFIIGTCLIAIIPILIFSFFSYTIASSSLQQELGRAKIETLKQVQQRIDDKLITINKNAIQHLYTASFDSFLSKEDLTTDLATYRDVKSLLSSIEVLVDNVESASLYLKKTDQLIIHDSIRPAEEYMAPILYEKIQNNKEAYFWVDDLNEHSSHRRSPKNITYVRAVPLKAEEPLGYIIIRLNDRTFFEVYDKQDNTFMSEMLIITPSGTVFSDWNRDMLQDDLSQYPLVTSILNGDEQESSFYEYMDNKKMLVSYWQSPLNNWSYVSIIPTTELMSSFNKIKKITIIACSALILACLAAALFVSRNFYNGIKSIVDRIRGKSQWSGSGDRKDEIGLINSYMDTLQDLNTSLHNQVKRDKPILASGFVQSILLEHVRKKDMEQQFEYFDLPRESSFYSALCVELNVAEELDEKDVQLFVYAATNICEEIFAANSPGMITKAGPNQIALIMNHTADSVQGRMNEAFRVAEEISAAIFDSLSVEATIGIGRCYERIDIRKSFMEARNALQYRLVIGTGHVIYVEQVEPLQAENAYEYPHEIEQQMMMQVKVGNLEQVSQLLDQFSNKLREDSNITAAQVLMSYTQLVSHAVREFYNIAPEAAAALFSYNVFDKLTEMPTMSHIQQWVYHHVFVSMSKYFESIRTEKSYKTMEQVLTYIAEHYDEDISQPQMAEMAGIPPSHFSQMFKDELGITFSDYIILYRMDKAKELLLQTDMKIFEIAEHLRYQNSQNFIRTFKKTHGMTPGEYRSKEKKDGA